jgi:hypothetical protein
VACSAWVLPFRYHRGYAELGVHSVERLRDGKTMCSLGRLAFPTLVTGLVVATLSGSAAVGWLAALAVAGALYLVNRRRPSPACGLPRSSARAFDGLARGEDGKAGTLVGDAPSLAGQGDEPARNRGR